MSVSDHQINKILEEFLGLHPKKIDLSLNRVKKLLSKLDNPHEKIDNCIVVSGTNAKFSTLRFMQEILRYNNKILNTYISPHLLRFNERFESKNEQISNKDLEKALIRIKEINNSESITFFEATSSIFYDLCSRNKSDYTIIETGLGGMYDTSALVKPILTIITPISFDHIEFLAPRTQSIQEISFAKSGSIKEQIPCIIGKQTYKEALNILIDQADYKKSPLFIYGRDWIIYEKDNKDIIYEDNKNKFKFNKFKHHPVYQVENLGLAIAALSNISNLNIGEFLNQDLHNNTEIIGRFQKIENQKLNNLCTKNNEIIYDGGHNESSFQLSESIEKLEKKPLCIVIGMLNSKTPKYFISKFNNINCIRTVTIPNEENAISADKLREDLKKYCEDTIACSSVAEAIKQISNKYPTARILITGSFYLSSEVLDS